MKFYGRRLFGVVLLVLLVGLAVFAPYQVFYGDNSLNEIVLTSEELGEFVSPYNNCSIHYDGRAVFAFSNEKKTVDLVVKRWIFPLKRIKAKVVEPKKVYVGGVPVGINIACDGVLVVGNSLVMTKDGKVDACEGGDIKKGDIIIEISGIRIKGTSDIAKVLNDENYKGEEIELKVSRKGKEITTKVSPKMDCRSNTYRLGLWIQDSAAGIGTMTYVKCDNMHYGALGHPVVEGETASAVPVADGNIYPCVILGVVKGQRGKPGELRGVFSRQAKPLGSVRINNKFGVFGECEKLPQGVDQEVVVANRASIKPGKATLVTTVDSQRGEFEVEIVKASYQKNKDHKSMVVRVTDKKLLEKTGGIVQGMSGSPILQNGKLVGALTHVFINDPTRGYGVYLDWMYDEY